MEISKVVEKLIIECERMRNSLNEHLQQLCTLAEQLNIPIKQDQPITTADPSSSIRAEIERRRQELMAQVEQVRAQAQAQAVEARRSIGDRIPNAVPSMMPGMMPGMGMMPNFVPDRPKREN